MTDLQIVQGVKTAAYADGWAHALQGATSPILPDWASDQYRFLYMNGFRAGIAELL